MTHRCSFYEVGSLDVRLVIRYKWYQIDESNCWKTHRTASSKIANLLFRNHPSQVLAATSNKLVWPLKNSSCWKLDDCIWKCFFKQAQNSPSRHQLYVEKSFTFKFTNVQVTFLFRIIRFHLKFVTISIF